MSNLMSAHSMVNMFEMISEKSAVLQGSRKRHLSNASTVVDEGASPRKRAAPSSSGRPSRKNAKVFLRLLKA